MVSGNETRVMQKLVVIFFRKNVGVSYHNHDDDHHAIFGGHALPSVHKWGLKFYEFVFFFYNYSILRNCYASDLYLIESYEII